MNLFQQCVRSRDFATDRASSPFSGERSLKDQVLLDTCSLNTLMEYLFTFCQQ